MSLHRVSRPAAELSLTRMAPGQCHDGDVRRGSRSSAGRWCVLTGPICPMGPARWPTRDRRRRSTFGSPRPWEMLTCLTLIVSQPTIHPRLVRLFEGGTGEPVLRGESTGVSLLVEEMRDGTAISGRSPSANFGGVGSTSPRQLLVWPCRPSVPASNARLRRR